MPLYDYKCPQGHRFEATAKMSDMSKRECPECHEMAKRQISAPNSTFKLRPGESYLDTKSFNHLTGKNHTNRRPE